MRSVWWVEMPFYFSWRQNTFNLSWFHCFIASDNSRLPPLKFVPLSNLISAGFPRLAMKRRSALMKESVSMVCATSICTARMVKHVKRTPYLFTMARPLFTLNGPKQSTPTNVNGGWSGTILSGGKSAIFCWFGLWKRRLQSKQLPSTLLTDTRPLTIQ